MNNISYSDFKNICRMCMLSCDIKFAQDNTISDVFYKLTDIHFETNDELPQHICLKCFDKVNEIYQFAFQCKRTQASLLKCINDFKNAQMNEDHETLEGINEPLKTEEEIDEHEIDLFKDEVLSSASEFVIAELNVQDDIEDKNNELEENLIPETSNDQNKKNINCSKDVFVNPNTANIKVENEEDSIDNGNRNDPNKDTYSLDISDSAYINSAKNNENNSKKHYKCDVCNKTYIQLTAFKKHIRLSNCERPFKCEQCSTSFIQSSQLKAHMRIHSDERPYKCKECSQSFSHSSHLKMHMRAHIS